MKKAFFAFPIALALAGCASGDNAAESMQTAANSLDGTSWMMVIPKDSSCEVPPMIEFGSDTVSGDMGCNRFEGSYEVRGNAITFKAVAATMKLCADPYMKLESRMQQLLANAATFEKTETALRFLGKDGKEILTLVPEKAGACD